MAVLAKSASTKVRVSKPKVMKARVTEALPRLVGGLCSWVAKALCPGSGQLYAFWPISSLVWWLWCPFPAFSAASRRCRVLLAVAAVGRL